MTSRFNKSPFFLNFSWFFLAITIVTILGGAFVRATGSGAGCGEHWPLCNGTILPAFQRYQTLIEFTHRIMSGLIFVLSFFMVLFSRRFFAKNHICRTTSLFVFFIMI
ncbi:MAG: COX15/CtaA family protein, partial [Silvanigrellaceae bacterium]|nr:COX15/CtaA family protein [Silvanigrellaceae bacterium]